jgi:hypothetical protein
LDAKGKYSPRIIKWSTNISFKKEYVSQDYAEHFKLNPPLPKIYSYKRQGIYISASNGKRLFPP